MRLSAPAKNTFRAALVLGVVGIVAEFIPLGSLSAYSFWLVAVAFAALLLGSLLDAL